MQVGTVELVPLDHALPVVLTLQHANLCTASKQTNHIENNVTSYEDHLY